MILFSDFSPIRSYDGRGRSALLCVLKKLKRRMRAVHGRARAAKIHKYLKKLSILKAFIHDP
jgi:hypothetical protein